jgi:hypothetical protein
VEFGFNESWKNASTRLEYPVTKNARRARRRVADYNRAILSVCLHTQVSKFVHYCSMIWTHNLSLACQSQRIRRLQEEASSNRGRRIELVELGFNESWKNKNNRLQYPPSLKTHVEYRVTKKVVDFCRTIVTNRMFETSCLSTVTVNRH